MERLTAALSSNVDGSATGPVPQTNEDLNRLLDEITFRLERRFLLRLFDKHGVPSSQLDSLPPVPKCFCQCNHQCQSHGITTPGPSTSASGSAYEDIEVLRYKARMIVGNAVDDAIHSASYESIEGNQQLSDCRTNKNPEHTTDIFATIGGPDNMSATNSLYVVRRAALRTLLKYTGKGKANALLHLTDYLQQQHDNIEEENAYLDVKAKTKKPKVRFETLVEENNDDMDDSDEHNDILHELPTIETSKKKKVKIEKAFENSRSDPVSLDSNYTFNLRKSARHSLSKYLHKPDAANAMMHLFDSTTRLELADSFAEIHASDDDMQDLLHTPYFGSVASSGAAPKKQLIPSDRYNRKPYPSGQSSTSPDQRREKTSTIPNIQKSQNVAESQSRQLRMERPCAAKEMSPQRILVTKDEDARSAGYVPNSNGTRENQYNVCVYCQSYLGDTGANLTTNNSNTTRNNQHLSPELNHERNRHNCQNGSDNDYTVNGTSDSEPKVISTDATNDDTNSRRCLVKGGRDERPETQSDSFEYNPSPKKVIRLQDSSTSHHQEIDNDTDLENSVSQKVGYFDRVLNPPIEDARPTTKEAESIDMTEETRAKVGFWERWCGCHSNPNH